MASPIEEAVAGLVAARINPSPLAGVTPKIVDQAIEEGAVALDNKKLDVMLRIQDIIDDAQKSGRDPKVIAGFQRMLDRY